jgi:hypothetical protein
MTEHLASKLIKEHNTEIDFLLEELIQSEINYDELQLELQQELTENIILNLKQIRIVKHWLDDRGEGEE